jgi:hypothetical protein
VAKLENGARVIAVEVDCCLELHLRFGQSVLSSAEDSHREVRRRAVRITLESFEEKPLGSRFILLKLNRTASFYYEPDICGAD